MGVDAFFKKVETVGRRVRWFINPIDVQFLPHLALGRGGFGIAAAGAYFRSQVLRGSLNELQSLRLGRHPGILVLTVQW